MTICAGGDPKVCNIYRNSKRPDIFEEAIAENFQTLWKLKTPWPKKPSISEAQEHKENSTNELHNYI